MQAWALFGKLTRQPGRRIFARSLSDFSRVAALATTPTQCIFGQLVICQLGWQI
jgi:hypothetical protein